MRAMRGVSPWNDNQRTTSAKAPLSNALSMNAISIYLHYIIVLNNHLWTSGGLFHVKH